MDEDDERPPSWAGAPGYTPYVELPPHAPMPGAPPYPPDEAPPPAPVGQAPPRTRVLPLLAAAAGWALLDVVLALTIAGREPDGRAAFGLALAFVATVLAVWPVARRRAWGLGGLLLATAPVFWALRAILGAVLG